MVDIIKKVIIFVVEDVENTVIIRRIKFVPHAVLEECQDFANINGIQKPVLVMEERLSIGAMLLWKSTNLF